MATTSLIPAVKDALTDLLKAAVDGDVEVHRNLPVADTWPQQMIHIDPRAVGSHTYRLLASGRKPREEEFTVTVVFDVFLPHREPEDAETRLFELFAVLQDVVADDPTLGLNASGVRLAQVGDYRYVADWGEVGSAAHMEADVTVTAHLN